MIRLTQNAVYKVYENSLTSPFTTLQKDSFITNDLISDSRLICVDLRTNSQMRRETETHIEQKLEIKVFDLSPYRFLGCLIS